MYISLPSSWYTNTQEKIDKDFLLVSENNERKLKKYLKQQSIMYNLVSKDLTQEINVVLQKDSGTEVVFDLNTIDDKELINEAEMAVNQNNEDNKEESAIVYSDYAVEKINECKYIILKGKLKSENQSGKIVQYSTTINGYGMTISYRGYEDATFEAGDELMEKIISGIEIKEVLVSNRKSAVFKALMPITAVTITLAGVAIYARKRKKKSDKEWFIYNSKMNNIIPYKFST